MSTSESHDNEDVIKTENNTPSQDEAQTQQNLYEPQENEAEPLLVKKPLKRKLKKDQVPITEDDKLIQLVRCMRCLYDPQHPRHQDSEVRKDLWDIIGKSMDLPGTECGKRWSNIKKKFKDIIKNKRKGNWKLTKSLNWYEEYLQIIIDTEERNSLDYPSTSKCTCNIMSHDIDVFLSGLLPTLKSLNPAEQDLAKTQLFDIVRKYEQFSTNVIEIKVEMDWTECNNSNTCEEKWQNLIDKFTKSKDKKRKYKELRWMLEYISKDETESDSSDSDRQKKNTFSSEEVTFLHDIDCQCNTATLAHPMQKFLAEISSILKKLPLQQQNLAKLEIFEITNKFDLKKSIDMTVSEIKTEIDSDE